MGTHYRGDAAMSCFLTNLAFFLLLNKKIIVNILNMLIDSVTLRQKFEMSNASGIKKCYLHEFNFKL